MRIPRLLRHLSLVTVAATIGAACDNSSPHNGPTDASTYPVDSALPDARPPADAPRDAVIVVPPDAPVDAPIDGPVPVDAPIDATPPVDAPIDAAPPLTTVTSFATFNNTVAVGVAVSRTGRVFISTSRAIEEHVPYSVAEMMNGLPHVYPAGFNQNTGAPAPDRLLSVQALTVDAKDRLWILDCAKVGQATIAPGAAKLVAVDLRTNAAVKTIQFPQEIAGQNAMLNDVRIDMTRGTDGVAFVTDSSSQGPNGIIVVDLATGAMIRRLNDDPSTKPQPNLVVTSEGVPLTIKQGAGTGTPFRVGSDGIALDTTGHVYYRALTGHHLYRVSADALATPTTSDTDVAATIEDLGDLGFASDGLLADAQGRLYLTDFENGAIHRRNADGTIQLIAQDPQLLLWPDSLALRADGTLLITATQIERSPLLHGTDARTLPFTIWKLTTDSTPLFLGSTTP
jgi:sugar lactone lactonase YvrE